MTDNVPAPAQLRRLPWRENDKAAYLSTGGGVSLIGAMADAMEEGMLATAEADASRATTLTEDVSASRAELRMAVRYLCHAIADAVEVARLRGERLPLDAESECVAETLRRDLTA
ncbi:hypothetical protein ACFVZD_42730 [Streptomyces sp. NPDC058287]|uniref:hypothetical protein n=1 Tax=unclassified Streptomyces TaxID=2593676 RepID=UPI0036EB5F68